MKNLILVLGIVIGIMGTIIGFLLFNNSNQTSPREEPKSVFETSKEDIVVKEELKTGWHEVLVTAGTSIEDTKSFFINEDATKWRITYTLKDAPYLPSFKIDIYDNSSKELVQLGMTSNGLSELIASEGTKEVLIDDIGPGEYYLNVFPTNIGSWDVVVEELY